MKVLNVWEMAQDAIKQKIGNATYATWFSTLQIKEKNEHTLIIETPDEFYKNWIVEHYSPIIQESLNQNTSQPISVEFQINHQLFTDWPVISKWEKEKKGEPSSGSLPQLNPRYTFDHFVVGPANRFAFAASMAVAESPGKAYNPLFIYGSVGLGKTHLIQAITHQIRIRHPALNHCYLTSERFTNELIEAIRHRSTNQFRKKYRYIDVLLIDDIHFIAGKESTQEEFFHTFNALHNSRKQIIITSDRPPKEISNLEERLQSRFVWGLIADIQPPDFETRVAILRKKIEHETVQVPDEVILFIAEEIHTNIRELEGALIRVVAYSLLEEKPISLEMGKVILKDMLKQTSSMVSMERIMDVVAEHYHMKTPDLRTPRRNKNIVLPRQIAMYLSRQLTSHSLPEIGMAFGGRDHTTVLHSWKKIQKNLTGDMALKNMIEQITVALKSR